MVEMFYEMLDEMQKNVYIYIEIVGFIEYVTDNALC